MIKEKEIMENVKRIKDAIGSGTEIHVPSVPKEKKSNIDLLMDFAKGKLGGSADSLRKNLGKNVRKYLNAEETRTFQWLLITVLYGESYRKTFMHFGNMSKVEHRHLKTGLTHLAKYCEAVLRRLDDTQVDDMIKKTDGASIRIFDQPTLKKLMVSTSKAMENTVVERDSLELFSELIMHQHCRNCTVACSVCRIYKTFQETYIPESGYQLENCPYAYFDLASEARVDESVNALLEIRHEKKTLMENSKFESFSKEISAEIAALDKAIELLIESKGDIRLGVTRDMFFKMLEKKDYDPETKAMMVNKIETYVKEGL